jgi:serine/threonine protein kinase/tetratricopeptide (TPR) repeat protein
MPDSGPSASASTARDSGAEAGGPAEIHPRIRERFEVGRCLGSGTFGVVYEAKERKSGARVALKRLSLSDASAIYGFKQEFRALADVVHGNLVGLHELFSADDELYLSMELVDGVDFLSWVRARAPAGEPSMADRPTLADDGEIPVSGAPVTVRSASPVTDVERLRPALAQLARGVLAIHQAKKLHRDLKPSNVLVTADGRLKILDFGLVAASSPRSVRRPASVVGTPAYMSPEQAAGQPLGPASDWYAVGVILYEALTGTLPIDGEVREILAGKQALEAADPRAVAPGVPDDLAELCFGLLQRDPRARPTGAAVIRALGADPGAEPDLDLLPLVGREHHLAMLEEAFAAVRAGHSVTVLVHGSSGMGKTALLRRFLDDAAETHGALILEGRSYERESVPYKALDPLVDGLADHLGALPRSEVEPLVGLDVATLARLFPVLRRLPGVAEAKAPADAPDPQEARRRASAALRALLGRLAMRHPLVLALDDLQWGDADSASLLLDLLAPPDPPPLLLLAGYRSEDAAGIDLVGALLRRMARGEPVGDVREVVVGPLSPREARVLARALLSVAGPTPEDDGDDVEGIARESGGSPFYVRELSRHVLAVGRGSGPVSLRDVLAHRVGRLAPHARRLLTAVAAAGRPTAVAALERAAEIDDPAGALSILRAEHLVRTRMAGGVREVEPFHDRIRETALARVAPADLAALHLRLAHALEEAGGADPEALAFHFEAGGDLARAREQAEIAADRAAFALAFDRAAALYRRALPPAGAATAAPRALLVKLGHALANAGRGAEAARAYLEALAGAPADLALDLRRRAAEQFLRAGHVDEGLAAVRDVLAAVDLTLPRTPARAFASLVYRRARLSIRGFDFEEREGGPPPSPEALTRIDVCWSVGNGLAGVDTVRGADFQARHLLYALEAGDPYRISRALSSEAIFAAMEGGKGGAERAAKLIERARAVADRIGHPHAIAWAAGAAAGARFYEARFSESVTLADRAIRLFRANCSDILWELGSIICWWLLPALFYLGRMEELSRRLPAYLKEAEDLGALYNVTSLRTLTAPRVLLAMDRPADARREVDDAIRRWSQHGWQVQHWCAMYMRTAAALYEGEGIGAHAEVEGSWPELDGSLMLRVESVRIESLYLRGNAAMAASGEGSDGEHALSVAEKAARTLGRESGVFTPARPYAIALRAAAALARGQASRAAGLYDEAERAFGALEMGSHAAAARRRRGEIVGGEEGASLCGGADAWLRDHGWTRPDRAAAMLVPAPP